MCQPPRHRVARRSLAATAPTPAVRFHDPASQNGTIGLKPLTDDFEGQFIEPEERGQVRASEGSVKRVEVFLMGSVRTPSSEDLDRYPAADAPTTATPSTVESPYSVVSLSGSVASVGPWCLGG